MTRNKFNEELKQLLNSVRVMGVNLEDTLDKVIANLEHKDAALAQQIISSTNIAQWVMFVVNNELKN